MLTAKQEAFCLAVVEGKNASDAYRSAYDTGRMQVETIWRRANELMKNGKVAARIAALRASVAQGVQMTLERHLIDLRELRDAARGKGQFAAAINAEVARGKAAGLYSEKLKIEHSGNVDMQAEIRLALLERRRKDEPA